MSWVYDRIKQCYIFQEGGVIPKYLRGRLFRELITAPMDNTYVAPKHIPMISPPLVNRQPKPTPVVQDYNTLRDDYIKALENPDMVGYDAATDRWTPPTKKGYDPNQIGIGLDMNNNTEVALFLKLRGEKWMTDAEMRKFYNNSMKYYEGVFDRQTKGYKFSDAKRAMAIGLIYHGHGPKLWKRSNEVSKALFTGTDLDFIDAVTSFYGTNDRASRHSLFWQNRPIK